MFVAEANERWVEVRGGEPRNYLHPNKRRKQSQYEHGGVAETPCEPVREGHQDVCECRISDRFGAIPPILDPPPDLPLRCRHLNLLSLLSRGFATQSMQFGNCRQCAKRYLPTRLVYVKNGVLSTYLVVLVHCLG